VGCPGQVNTGEGGLNRGKRTDDKSDAHLALLLARGAMASENVS